MNLIKLAVFFTLFIGSVGACEQSFQIELDDSSGLSSCKELILDAMAENNCSESSLDIVSESEVRISPIGGATSLCFLDSDIGHFTVVQDSINELTPVSVVFSLSK